VELFDSLLFMLALLELALRIEALSQASVKASGL